MSAWMTEIESVMDSSKARLIEMYKAPLLAFWEKIAPTGELTRKELSKAVENVPQHLRDIHHYVKEKGPYTGKWCAVMILDEERMTKIATNYADDQIAKLKNKLAGKLEEIDSVTEVRVRLSQLEFTFVGERAGKKIVLHQQAVFKVSSKNTPFVQFPARFHVDGKSATEAAYKKMFAAT